MENEAWASTYCFRKIRLDAQRSGLRFIFFDYRSSTMDKLHCKSQVLQVQDTAQQVIDRIIALDTESME